MKETPNKKQSFIQGAAMLAATVAVVKIVGAIYKIPLYNILGDEGTAHFTIAYSIFSVLLTLSTAGLPVALSRMVAAANAKGRHMQVKRIFRVALAAFFVLGAIGTLIMLLFPQRLAAAMDNVEAARSILALSPAVVLVCLMSAYRGYTQGLSDMVPTSVSQIIEVLCKLVFGLSLAWLFLKKGYGLPTASAGAIIGVTIGELIGLLYCMFYKLKTDASASSPTPLPELTDSRRATLLQLAKIGIPIAVSSSVVNLIALADAKLILNRLQYAAGFTFDEAKVLFGVYSKVQTLFNFPSAFIVPLTISAIPAISVYLTKRENDKARGIAEASIKLTNLFAIPAGVGLAVLAYPIMNVLYPGSHATGPALLIWLGASSYFVCLMLSTNAVLQAYGFERFPIYTIIAGGAVKVALNWILVGNSQLAAKGAAIASLACYAVISAINLIVLRVRIKGGPRLARLFIKPLISSAFMGLAAVFVYKGVSVLALSAGLDTQSRLWMGVCMLAAIVIAVVVYFIAIVLTKAITADDLALVPKGSKISRFLRIKM